MATKSKKSKAFQLRWKAIGVILFLICAISIFFCGVVTVNISKEWGRDVINAETVYDSAEFEDYFHQTLDHVVMADVYYQNEKRIESGEVVDREELIAGFKRYYGIVDGIITGNTEINATYDGLIINGNIPESLQANLKEYQELVESRLPSYYKMYIQRQLDEYKSSMRYLEELGNFLYYIEDENGNLINGNATRAEVEGSERTLVLSAGFSSDHLGNSSYHFNTYVNPILEESNLKFYGAIRDPLMPGDHFYEMWQNFSYAKQSLPILFGVFFVSLVGAIVCLVHLIRVTGQKERYGKVQLAVVDRIYNEVHFLLVVLYVIASVVVASALIDTIMGGTVQFWSYVFTTMLGVLYLAAVGIGLSYVLSVSRQVKNRSFFRNTWISASIRRMSELFTGRTFRGWMVIVMLCYGLGNCALMGALVLAQIYGYLDQLMLLGMGLILFNAFCMFLFIRALGSLKEIMVSAKESSKGNFSYPLDLNKISPSFLNFAEDVANIQEGFKNAVDDAVKGERMKAELITNVSHDLKTPLTSIISYVDLLKNEKLENETASAYVDILYDKSYRLKQLIEDLIEASKASSGNLTVEKMRVDYKQLTLQAMGEMEDKTEAVGLTFKMSCPEPVYIDADGGHMWRILENLLSNVIKYSMPDSRVYVDIFKLDGYGVLVMKNISASPIDFDETRLTERFVRGDESRTTEGSGLGLSITQSLAELQGGTFGIQVDGDLFKSIVSIPLWVDEAEESEDIIEKVEE
ncbi:MAG: HAMP domain-containing histidine kinase [Anaerotignum sp.]|nr:HAMP domain-containing histidine kinase [Anaerotignum sp.]